MYDHRTQTEPNEPRQSQTSDEINQNVNVINALHREPLLPPAGAAKPKRSGVVGEYSQSSSMHYNIHVCQPVEPVAVTC